MAVAARPRRGDREPARRHPGPAGRGPAGAFGRRVRPRSSMSSARTGGSARRSRHSRPATSTAVGRLFAESHASLRGQVRGELARARCDGFHRHIGAWRRRRADDRCGLWRLHRQPRPSRRGRPASDGRRGALPGDDRAPTDDLPGQRDGRGRPDRLTANRNAAATSRRHTGTLPLVLNPTNEDPNLESRRPPYRHPDASGAQGPRPDHSSKELFPPPCPPIEHLRAPGARGPSPRRWAGSRSSFSSSWRASGAIGAIAAVGVYASLAEGLPDPRTLQDIPIAEESIVYDRTGKIELARFGDAQARGRHLRRDPEGPPRCHDRGRGQDVLGERRLRSRRDRVGRRSARSAATAAAPRRSPSSSSAARLLDPALVQDPHRTAERKLKEIIQSIRLTKAFPGEQGKQTIITAYLNQNYYGNQSYGVKAAVDSYFGIDLSKITPSQAAIIAGLPKSPSNYDLVRNAIEKCSVDRRRGRRLCPRSGAGRPRRHHGRPAPEPDP